LTIVMREIQLRQTAEAWLERASRRLAAFPAKWTLVNCRIQDKSLIHRAGSAMPLASGRITGTGDGRRSRGHGRRLWQANFVSSLAPKDKSAVLRDGNNIAGTVQDANDDDFFGTWKVIDRILLVKHYS
jgi:hypothetical protein